MPSTGSLRQSVSRGLLLLLTSALVLPLAAQQTDEGLGDHEEQDRRYLERYKSQNGPEAEPEPASEVPVDAEAFIAKADELIRDRNYRSFTSDLFRVQTDDPRLDPKAAAELLESFRGYFDGFWAGGPELRRYDVQSRAFLFYSFYKYNQLLSGDWRFRDERPKGHYRRGIAAITLHTDADGARNVADAMIHESAHQLVEERIYTKGFASSPWVSEGLATYFGYTYRDRDGKFHPGVIGGKEITLIRDATRGAPSESKTRLQELKRHAKSRNASPKVTDVISIREPDVFYSQARWTYPASWVVVHYLLHGDGGNYRPAFMRYIHVERLGRGGAEALYRELGTNPDDFNTAVTAYLKRLSSR